MCQRTSSQPDGAVENVFSNRAFSFILMHEIAAGFSKSGKPPLRACEVVLQLPEALRGWAPPSATFLHERPFCAVSRQTFLESWPAVNSTRGGRSIVLRGNSQPTLEHALKNATAKPRRHKSALPRLIDKYYA